MTNLSFKQKLVRSDLLIGTIVTLPAPEITEIYSQAGFDWLFIDLEHSTLSIKDAQAILQTAGEKAACLIRVPSIDEAWIKRVLDIGPAGIIIPQVKSAEEAKLAIQLCKYPPEGLRSVGLARAHEYGEKFQEYVASANNEVAVVLQIEHIDAVHNIEEIIKVPGIDSLFIGPYDLSASMGKTGQVTDPEIQNAIAHVKKIAEEANIPLGIFGASADAVKAYIEEGYSLITVGIDTMLIAKTAKDIVNALK
ncbi:MAG: 2,4-dihydroxyhept-2-ene-1,7-dioic acid aldolase [Chloroflexi bacterium]|nr:2,4-dihydroxyhept-2-ene-1,7-dioic acid aldolase [Chloroflexota bacterium]